MIDGRPGNTTLPHLQIPDRSDMTPDAFRGVRNLIESKVKG